MVRPVKPARVCDNEILIHNTNQASPNSNSSLEQVVCPSSQQNGGGTQS